MRSTRAVATYVSYWIPFSFTDFMVSLNFALAFTVSCEQVTSGKSISNVESTSDLAR
jgi:hypothetical protein